MSGDWHVAVAEPVPGWHMLPEQAVLGSILGLGVPRWDVVWLHYLVEQRASRGRRAWRFASVFPRYVFFRGADPWAVSRCRGVAEVLRSGERFATVDWPVMGFLRRHADPSDLIPLAKARPLEGMVVVGERLEDVVRRLERKRVAYAGGGMDAKRRIA